AGIAVGPFTPGFIADRAIAEQLAELGVVLLMFGVGLHFHVRELWAVKRFAIPGAIIQIAVATVLAWLATRAFGFSTTGGLVFGLAISVASTVVLLRVLSDNDALHTKLGHIAIGWLLVEDLFTVLVLVLLPLFASQTGSAGGDVLRAVLFALGKVALLGACAMVLGTRLIPRLLDAVARTRSRELFTLAVLVIALGIAVGSAKLFGVSMALGAFLAGSVVGQSEFSTRAASEALPMRDAFAVLFFVAMGMLFDPSQLAANAGLTLVTLAIVIVGKPLAAFAVMMLLGSRRKPALGVAVVLAQIGEFSFIVAALGRQLQILPEPATQALIAAAILSITLNPILYRVTIRLARWLDRGAAAEPTSAPTADHHQAIVVGYGPVGRAVVEQLSAQGIAALVVELNHDTVRDLHRAGIRALYGDASQAEVLLQGGVEHADFLVYSASGPPTATIRQAKALNPKIAVFARTALAAETEAVLASGAQVVVSAEREVALAMTSRILRDLGATEEQLERARARVRGELSPA
ncbi:MAG: cation:proton antiporter, partial [Myxococcales bacterium]|nr:cation:proton antiporter [Myxococcales bacterium]